jgi:ferredoxin
LFNRISLFKVKVDASLCNKCNLCAKSCPIGDTPYTKSLDCIKCLECRKVCPQNAVSFKI